MGELTISEALTMIVAALAVTVEVEAMKAANQERRYKGKAPAYVEEHFREMAERLYGLVLEANPPVEIKICP